MAYAHVNRNRKPHFYCKAKCALCWLAAVFMLSGLKDSANRILSLKAGESLSDEEAKKFGVDAVQSDLDSLKRKPAPSPGRRRG